LDTVALLEDLPEKGLYKGQVGVLVEELAEGMFEVEFSDNEGRSYALAPLHSEQLLVLYHQPVAA
jgi:hypothetical protein